MTRIAAMFITMALCMGCGDTITGPTTVEVHVTVSEPGAYVFRAVPDCRVVPCAGVW